MNSSGGGVCGNAGYNKITRVCRVCCFCSSLIVINLFLILQWHNKRFIEMHREPDFSLQSALICLTCLFYKNSIIKEKNYWRADSFLATTKPDSFLLSVLKVRKAFKNEASFMDDELNQTLSRHLALAALLQMSMDFWAFYGEQNVICF